MFFTYLSGEYLKKLYSFLTKKQLIYLFFVDSFHIHQNIHNLFIAIQSNQVQIEESLQSTRPSLIKFQYELLEANFLLLQSGYFQSVDYLGLFFSIFIQPHGYDDTQAQKIVLH